MRTQTCASSRAGAGGRADARCAAPSTFRAWTPPEWSSPRGATTTPRSWSSSPRMGSCWSRPTSSRANLSVRHTRSPSGWPARRSTSRSTSTPSIRRESLGAESAGQCAGGGRRQFSMEASGRLQRRWVKMLADFEAETGHPADFRQIGSLFVLTLPQQVEDFRNNMEMWHRVGLTEARWVDAAEVSRMVPVLNVEDVLGCTFCPTDGIASPADVTSGYAAAAKRHGARLKQGVEVIRVDVSAGWCPTAGVLGRLRAAGWGGSSALFCRPAAISLSQALSRRCRGPTP